VRASIPLTAHVLSSLRQGYTAPMNVDEAGEQAEQGLARLLS
jgi:hypothetical protein